MKPLSQQQREAREFCRNTPRLKEESGVAFYERVLALIARVREETLAEIEARMPKARNASKGQMEPEDYYENSGYNSCLLSMLSHIKSIREGV